MEKAIKRIRSIPRLEARASDAHKGTFGRVLVIGGSVGMVGAPAMAGLSALRGGAGLVTIATPESVQPTAASICPCATTLPLPETRNGQIDPTPARRCLEERGFLPDDAPFNVVAFGPGLGMGPPQYGDDMWRLIDAFRRQTHIKLVVDADALNLLHKDTGNTPSTWNTRLHPRTVITPHPGELARMHGASVKDIQDNRQGFAIQTARTMNGNGQTDAVVVLKGAGTIVTDGWHLYVNKTGNPGMATGGSGDVLTGIIAAMLAQGMSTFDAAVAGAYVHGLAGDIAAKRLSQTALIATDIIDALGEATRKLQQAQKKRS
jgi:NAD(P)H-hydrate epimerase